MLAYISLPSYMMIHAESRQYSLYDSRLLMQKSYSKLKQLEAAGFSDCCFNCDDSDRQLHRT